MSQDPEGREPVTRKRRARSPEGEVEPAAGAHWFAALRRFFDREQWRFDQVEGRYALRLGCTGENGEWNCYAQIRENPGRFIFYSILIVRAPELRRDAIAEFIIRVNNGMVLGNFEMDYADGEIRYKTSACLSGGEPDFCPLIYTNLLITDKFLPAMMSVIYAGMSPEQAVEYVGD